MVTEVEIGSAVLHASTELWCNPEQSVVNSLVAPEEPSSSQLKITNSKILRPESLHVGDSMGPPPSKRSRGRPPATKVVSEVVNLDSDDDEDKNDKENVPNVPIEIPETQASIELPETQASELPETQESFVSAVNEISVDAEKLNEISEVNNNKRATRSATKSPEKAPATKEAASTSRFSNISSASLSNADLFNFKTSPSRNRKRKTSETVDAPIPSTSKNSADPKPAPKKGRFVVLDSDDEASTPPPVQKSSTRKRPATSDTDGLFSFNTSFAKRLKPTKEASQDPIGPSGIIALTPKPVAPSPVKKFHNDFDDSCDSGVWLSKAMISVNLNDDIDGDLMKIEPDLTLNKNKAEDIKPSSFVTLFSVLNTPSDTNSTTTSSMVSKRKQFVKKQNFKPQSNIVTMKLLKVEDTMIPLGDF